MPIFTVSNLIEKKNIILLNGISLVCSLDRTKRNIQERYEYSQTSKSVFTSSFKQSESRKLIYQNLGFIIRRGNVMHISLSDTGKENINMKEPISYLDKEMDDVLSSDRNNYNELIVAPDEIFGFFIKQYPTNEIIDKGEAPEWMTKDLVLKEMYYTKKDVSTFCKNNQLPLIRISDDNFYLVTDIFKKTEEVLNWQSFKNRLLSNNL